jgi:rsbT co-antagonist protein RsbR
VTNPAPGIERFRQRLERECPATGGISSRDVAAEVESVLPVLEELPIEDRLSGDFDAFEFREAFTLLALFGRRLGLLDLTPSAAVEIVEIALASVSRPEDPTTQAFDHRARLAAVEGFVRGREERVAADAALRARRAVRPLRIDRSAFALIVSGAHEPEAIAEYVDALGRAILDADARVGIVDLTQLDAPNRERARSVFAAEEVTRMLGARCVFSGVDPRWRAAATDARIDLDELTVTTTLAKGLALARELTERIETEAHPKWRMLLERLRR